MNEQKPYIERTVITYNPLYGDARICKCGHRYYRHFDSYENNDPVGCKYCSCRTFEEASLADRPLVLSKADVDNSTSPFLGRVEFDNELGGRDFAGILFPEEYVEELCKAAERLITQKDEFPELNHHLQLFESFIAIGKEAFGR